MQSFEWIDATSVEQAAGLLAQGGAGHAVLAKAGGIDIIDLMKEGILRPSRVVNLKSIPGLNGVAFDQAGGLSLGALVTLSHIEQHPEIVERFPALAEAARHAATPQVRNAATIGGNLLQRPRCWYFRNELFHDRDTNWGEVIAEGENQYHAIFDNAQTALVHASTLATPLIAYGAQVQLSNSQGKDRLLPISDLLLPPDPDRDRDAAIAPDEILTHVIVPAPADTTRAAYFKQTERDSYDWPICDVAVVLCMTDNTCKSAKIVMGWVSPTPRRAVESERLLVDKIITPDIAAEAARAAIAGATPLSKNGYKVPVLEAVVRRTILEAAA